MHDLLERREVRNSMINIYIHHSHYDVENLKKVAEEDITGRGRCYAGIHACRRSTSTFCKRVVRGECLDGAYLVVRPTMVQAATGNLRRTIKRGAL